MCLQKSKKDLPLLVPKKIHVILGRMRAFYRYFLTKQYHVRLNHLVEYVHYMAERYLSYGQSLTRHLEKAAKEKSLFKHELTAAFRP